MATRGLNPSTFSPRPIGKGQPGSYIDGPDPYYQPTWMLRGITKDANGAVLPGVTVDVFRALIPDSKSAVWPNGTTYKQAARKLAACQPD